jgi:hypothetical protein
MISLRGRRYAQAVLDQLSWWSLTEEIDARIIDRAVARFLSEIESTCCPRCGDEEIYAKGLCKRDFQAAWRRKGRQSVA